MESDGIHGCLGLKMAEEDEVETAQKEGSDTEVRVIEEEGLNREAGERGKCLRGEEEEEAGRRTG